MAGKNLTASPPCKNGRRSYGNWQYVCGPAVAVVVWLVGEGRSWSWRSHRVVGQLWIFVDLAENGVDLIGVWRCFRGWMRVVSCRGRRGAKKGVRLGRWWFAGCLNRKNLNLAKNRIGFHKQIQCFARRDRRRGPYEHFAGTSSGLFSLPNLR